MSDSAHQDGDDHCDSDADSAGSTDGRRPMLSGLVVSLAIHAVVLFIFSLVVLVAGVLEEEALAVKITQIDAPPPKPEQPRLERDVTTSEVMVDVAADTVSDQPSPISQLDIPVEDAAQREEDNDNPEPKGREEAVGDTEMGGQGAFMSIGAGGGAGGMFGSRSGGGKKRALGTFGGSKASESAVEAALRWFKKHQDPSGKWDPANYQTNCTENPKCEPTPDPLIGANAAAEKVEQACTGLVLLCFLGAGYDHRMPSKYKQVVRGGLDYVLQQQKDDGSWEGIRPGQTLHYSTGICTMALAEAYGMSLDPRLKEPAQKAVAAILRGQVRDQKDGYGIGWTYCPPDSRGFAKRCDSSITPWMALALKSARGAGLDVGDGMETAARWIDIAWKASNPNWEKLTDPYQDEADLYYDFDTVTHTKWYAGGTGSAPNEENGEELGHLSSAGALVSIFTGKKSGDIVLETLVNYSVNHQTPTKFPPNLYYLYYNTLVMFQMGGARWDKWNGQVRDLLVKAQRAGEGCFDGSWDYQGSRYYGSQLGRVPSTALCCLSLEVYYRYLPIAARGH
jgi:hypothetical protein